ncbi:hypothetical protein U9M73_06145 [Paenibacillus phoenicis]|uniref:Uncharacterized protein n=1 Tax=Paenibacillus phoenicis TaxID=554117 RepID=A0ABU5PIA2_9BACL|nr:MULTISPECIES: hypothetical protein [Paenibacillus]MEA3569577.1 hypothetical protein [Paenibacillus phoenicis]
MSISRKYQQLQISNISPMDMNFLLYIENIYECYFGRKEIFPGRYLILDQQELLEPESFIVALKACWNTIVKEYEQQQFMDNPLDTLHFRDDYASLFRNDSVFHTAERVWNAFTLWWWPDYGIKAYMEKFTDQYMPEVTEQIYRGLYEKNIPIAKGNSLYIMLLFKQPIQIIPKSSNKLFFSTIDRFLYKKDEIVRDIVDLLK